MEFLSFTRYDLSQFRFFNELNKAEEASSKAKVIGKKLKIGLVLGHLVWLLLCVWHSFTKAHDYIGGAAILATFLIFIVDCIFVVIYDGPDQQHYHETLRQLQPVLDDPRTVMIRELREMMELWNSQIPTYQEHVIAVRHNRMKASTVAALAQSMAEDRASINSDILFITDLLSHRAFGTVTGPFNFGEALEKMKQSRRRLEAIRVESVARLQTATEVAALTHD